MPFKYDRLFMLLKERGITSYKIRKENLISQAALTKMKNGEGNIDTRTLERLCELLDCQPDDLMEYVSQSGETGKIQELITLTVKKGTKEKLREEAEILGESLNEYIKKATAERYYNDCGDEIDL